MNPSIPDPVRGKDVLEWAVPVTRALNALHDQTGATVRNERDRRDRPPHPFEVRWAGEENDGDGAWVIWLPDVDTVLMADGSYVTPTGITAADALPDGWYLIDDLEDEGDVYLNVSISDSATTATFATDVGQSSTGTTVIAVKVACTAADTDDDDVTTHSVTQFVTSAVIIGGKGGSGGGDFKLPIRGEAPEELDDDQIIVAKRFDVSEHQLQVKVRGLEIETIDGEDFIVALTPASEWLMITGGQAVEHVSNDEQ